MNSFFLKKGSCSPYCTSTTREPRWKCLTCTASSSSNSIYIPIHHCARLSLVGNACKLADFSVYGVQDGLPLVWNLRRERGYGEGCY